MKKITIKSVDETIYYEKIDNGLEVYMLPKKMNNIYAKFTTRFGSNYTEFISRDKKKMIKVPYGIAHFLEHKMFERENGIDPMLFYAHNGADVNASTNKRNTSYEYYGPNHLKENLEYLLDYVQNPYFTDENVEKEKGIIEQEIVMYDDDPYSVAYDKISYNTFKNNPIKYSIAGTVKDIYSITKEQLYECYNTFYHPSNMFIVLTGNFDPDEVLTIIKENQAKKTFKPGSEIIMKKITEPNEVEKDYEEKQMNVLIPKMSYAMKIPLSHLEMDIHKRDFYIGILFDILFGATSSFYEKMKELEYIDSSIDIYIPYTEEHFLVTISCDTKKAKELINEIKKHLAKIEISEEEVERKKKSLISSQIYLYEDIKYINSYITNNLILYGNVKEDMVQLLKSLNKKELDSFIKKLDLKNVSILIINPLE